MFVASLRRVRGGALASLLALYQAALSLVSLKTRYSSRIPFLPSPTLMSVNRPGFGRIQARLLKPKAPRHTFEGMFFCMVGLGLTDHSVLMALGEAWVISLKLISSLSV